MLIAPERHAPLGPARWSESTARAAIERIAARTEAERDRSSGLWPLHPDDVDDDDRRPKRGVYLGAAGIVWALADLARRGHAALARSYAPLADGLDAAITAEPDEGEEGATGLFLGRTGVLAVAERLRPEPARRDALADLLAAHVGNPALELIYGHPGSMVVAAALASSTGEERWTRLFRAGADALLDRWAYDEELDAWAWTQSFGGRTERYVGAGHGLAGNVHALLRCRSALGDTAVALVEQRAVATMTRLAVREQDRANWPPLVGDSLALRGPASIRLQWCHGAPGVICALADAAVADDDWTRLLTAGGELVFEAGPLATGAGICHGTAGNGFALLALHRRTQDELWLERARRFAAHAAGQVEAAWARDGTGRHSLFTGDLGVALFLRACIEVDPRLPVIDVL